MQITLPARNNATSQKPTTVSFERSLVLLGPNGAGKTKFALELLAGLSGVCCRMISTAAQSREDDTENAEPAVFEHCRDCRPALPCEYDPRRFARFLKPLLQYQLDEQQQGRTGVLTQASEVFCKLFAGSKLVWNNERIDVQPKSGARYSALHLSDGEKAVLFVIGHVLTAERDSVVAVDEPENYLNQDSLKLLWDTLEQLRVDLRFVYVTHDFGFAVSRDDSEIVFIRSYALEGGRPVFSYYLSEDVTKLLDGGSLADEVLFRVLGNRQKLLFIEGTQNSHDYKIYKTLFPDWNVTPVGGCGDVKKYTNLVNSMRGGDEPAARGLVDRDRMAQERIELLKGEEIYTLKVAEIENVYLIEGVVKAVAAHLKRNPKAAFSDVKNNVFACVRRRFNAITNDFIREDILALVAHKLKTAGETIELNEVNLSVEELYNIKKKYVSRFNSIIERRDYGELLKYLNYKKLIYEIEIDRIFDLSPKAYRELVVKLLRRENDEGLRLRRIIRDYNFSDLN
ncbi:DUF4435 domain-containing protein [Feifania hominis]|uniref:AAA family ATPase n=1 Tax=Feifania hominis TaxID=2763660 RepID=A0A926HT97_9FIRM|nr:DUF4435 domain-containing protein [Feifania hominis]MBC8535639.1 AAA family ATPase [Feifania hominis]